jgi:hypothetical protein
MTPQCTEKTALLMAYTDAVKIYYQAVMALTTSEGRSQSESRKLTDLAEECRQKMEAARNVMNQHSHTHGC